MARDGRYIAARGMPRDDHDLVVCDVHPVCNGRCNHRALGDMETPESRLVRVACVSCCGEICGSVDIRSCFMYVHMYVPWEADV